MARTIPGPAVCTRAIASSHTARDTGVSSGGTVPEMSTRTIYDSCWRRAAGPGAGIHCLPWDRCRPAADTGRSGRVPLRVPLASSSGRRSATYARAVKDRLARYVPRAAAAPTTTTSPAPTPGSAPRIHHATAGRCAGGSLPTGCTAIQGAASAPHVPRPIGRCGANRVGHSGCKPPPASVAVRRPGRAGRRRGRARPGHNAPGLSCLIINSILGQR